MKGLEILPRTEDLERAYNQILDAERHENGKIDLKLFSTFCQWSRFDSRLGEICTSFLVRHWRRINPIELNEAFLHQPWPGVLGVLLEFCRMDSTLFDSWKKTATCNFQKANWEQFFIGKRRIGGQLMFDDARFSLEEYRRWGFLAREILINKQSGNENNKKCAPYPLETRSQILRDLLITNPRITTQQYWQALGMSISKRQAERDLKNSKLLKSVGATKGRHFLKR